MSTMDVHPYAAMFPLLSDAELDALADDIKANGLRHPIVITADGTVLDGRNRLLACDIAGVDPVYDTVGDDVDPIELIRTVNNRRRHMTLGQLAMAEAAGLALQGKRTDGRWARNALSNQRSDSSKWPVIMHQAGLIVDAAERWPKQAADLPARVVAGDIPFNAAVEMVKSLQAAETLAESEEQRPAREWLFEIAAIETAIESLADKPPELAYPITGADARAHDVVAKKIRAHLRRIAAFIEEQQ